MNLKKIVFLFLFSISSFSQGAVSTVEADLHRIESKVAALAKKRAILQEQKLRLETNLLKQDLELKQIKKTLSGNRKDIFQTLMFLKYIRENSNKIIFQGINSSSTLDRRQRLLEELTNHQMASISSKIKAVSGIEKKQKLVQSNILKLSKQEQFLLDLEKQISVAYAEKSKITKMKRMMPTFKGKLEWPVNFAAKEGKFGVNFVENSNLIYRNNGIFLVTENGAPVKNIYKGEVIFTGPLEGFGPTVIVDHGDHFYSVYSGLKNMTVRTGDIIEQMHQIAESSFVPNADLAGIYFELRHYTNAIDPEPWMKGFSR